jgi:ABC-2 type transport system ATP-binding protein
VIEVKNITKTYGEIRALDGVDFVVETGKVVGFLGSNGAGKTTTMDIICGCLGSDSGSVKICGIDLLEEPIEAKKKIGYLPDEPPIYDDMRVVDYVVYAAKLNQVPADCLKQRVEQALDVLSLQDVRNRVIGNLSKGYRQRVGLAQAIVHQPEVLILDEPTEGLDPNQIVLIRELIQNLGGKHTILLSSHILSEVQNTCDEIIIIDRGKVVKKGTYEQLLASLQRDNIYQLRVRNGSAELITQLQGLAAVQRAEVTSKNEMIEIRLDGGDEPIEQVAKLVIEGGYGLRELSVKARSLEAVFFELTHE